MVESVAGSFAGVGVLPLGLFCRAQNFLAAGNTLSQDPRLRLGGGKEPQHSGLPAAWGEIWVGLSTGRAKVWW